VAADATRERIVEAGLALIGTPGGEVRPFSMEGVAQEAGVARTTVYHQFGTKAALLEAIFDTIAVRGEIGPRIGAAFSHKEAREVLRAVIAAFAFFWETGRVVIRRIQGMSVLDPELEIGVHARDLRRREVMRVVVARLRGEGVFGDAARGDRDETVVDMLCAVTSFGTFYGLAGERSLVDVAGVVERMAWGVISANNPQNS